MSHAITLVGRSLARANVRRLVAGCGPRIPPRRPPIGIASTSGPTRWASGGPPRDWPSREPDALNPAHWNYDNVTGIAVLKNGDAWISSHANGLRRLNHDGRPIGDATAWLPGKSIGAIATDPLDDSVWIGFREPGLGIWRLRTDGTLLQSGAAALEDINANSAVWDIQVSPGPARRVVVAFRRGAVGIYQGN